MLFNSLRQQQEIEQGLRRLNSSYYSSYYSEYNESEVDMEVMDEQTEEEEKQSERDNATIIDEVNTEDFRLSSRPSN